jgi:phospholipid/cholesterol/gamma-HCH transport system substrate-binding protein
MERIRHRGLEIALGLALAALMVLGVAVIWFSFRGDFSSDITVSANLAQAGDALEQGDIVTYRSVIVGRVTDSSGSADGSAVAKLKIDKGDAAQIPATVTAVAVPASLFGNTKIELLPPKRLGGPTLSDGAVVAADTSPAAESLQTALSNAYHLLTAIHPAQLDAALSALATALDGQGKNLNRLIHRADDYLRKLAPHIPQFNDVITSLATVTDGLADNAPDLLQSLGNTLVVAKGILADKRAVAELLAIAPTALDNAQKLLNVTADNAVTIMRDQVGVTAALARNPAALADTLGGFRAFAETFNQVLTGKSIRVNVLITGVDLAEVPAVVAGEAAPVLHITDPPLYTPSDCPHYGTQAGPNCGAASPNSRHERLLTTTGTTWGGDSASVGSRTEQRVVRSAASTFTHLPAARIDPVLADLLLGPILRGTPAFVSPGVTK